jgi:uncharacterized MAPEG superfamily protein
MTPELTALATLVVVQIVFGFAVTGLVSTRTGTGYLLSSREQADVDLSSGLVGRMHRARVNGFEALVYFTPTVVVVELSGAATPATAALAWAFVAARLAFIACYALDLVPWRTIVWTVGTLAVAAMLLIALL